MGIRASIDCPEWLRGFIGEIVAFITPFSFIGEIGFCYLDPENKENNTNRWVIASYLLPYELAGGQKDGAHVLPEFSLDVSGLLQKFSKVLAVEWKVRRNYLDGLEGPEIVIEGTYKNDKNVQFHFYADPPSGEKPLVVFDIKTLTSRPKKES